MPEICRFFGIVIWMFDDDASPPHFHARYGKQSAAIAIETPALLGGWLPPRALEMVLEWARLRRRELEWNWSLTRGGRPACRIVPLD